MSQLATSSSPTETLRVLIRANRQPLPQDNATHLRKQSGQKQKLYGSGKNPVTSRTIRGFELLEVVQPLFASNVATLICSHLVKNHLYLTGTDSGYSLVKDPL